MRIFALYSEEGFDILDSLLVAIMAIVIVFLVLLLIIGVTSIFSKAINVVEYKTEINPRPENKILEEDNDAVVAGLVATIDYHNENKDEVRIVSIKRID